MEDLEEVFQILRSVPAGPDRDAAVANVVAIDWVAVRRMQEQQR